MPKVVYHTQKAKDLLAMQGLLKNSQWWSAGELKDWQFEHLNRLISHAARNVPYYSILFEKLGISLDKKIDQEIWKTIPMLSRKDIRGLEKKLFAKSYPTSLGNFGFVSTGGSTGLPVTIKKTEYDGFIWDSMNLREEIWHKDFFLGTIANFKGINSDLFSSDSFQSNAQEFAGGIIIQNWGAPTDIVWKTGKMGIMQPGKPLSDLANFLLELKPDYLLIKPSHLRLLLSYFHENQLKLDSLISVWTMSEEVDDNLRGFCKDIFGCGIISNYSSAEVGYIALQCPEESNLHIMAEANYVEVINQAGQECAPGELGKVVVTPLHNYAMPLIRYEIGDEVGLQTIRRIVGRTANFLVLKNGNKRQIDFSHYRLSAIRSIREFQLVQRSLEKIELRLVVTNQFTSTELESINQMMKNTFSKDFGYEINFFEQLPRTKSGKLMQFISELNLL
jgi:phenylacetate-CoA ligase